MSVGENSDFGPGYLEELSDYSNQDLRLNPEYAEVGEDFRKIISFKEAVKVLESSKESYHHSAKAVGSAWPEAYDAYVSIEETLEQLPEKMNAEKVMNSAFHGFEPEHGEVATRKEELKQAVVEAKKIYEQAAATLAMEVKNAALRGQSTPLEYAERVSDSEVFNERAEQLEKYVVKPEDSPGEVARLLDSTGPS